MDSKPKICDVLVVGAGISGLSTALETAETGFRVALVEKNPYVGGRVAQLNQYFPKLCPPTCGLEINIRRLRENPKIDLFTLAEVVSVSGDKGDYTVNVKQRPRYVNNRCTCCGDCEQACVTEREDKFNFGLNKTKAVYIPYNNAFPQKYVFEKELCNAAEQQVVKDSCKYNAIELEQQEELIEFKAKAIVWSTGWDPYDANNLDLLGYGKYPGVITNVEMERLASASGPNGGEIINPSGEPINKVAFVQCAGSRDENHLEYCSSVCCLASMKQARYIREQYPDSEIHIFYIDLRSPGVYEEFYQETDKDDRIFFHRGKVAKVLQQHGSMKLIVEAEDTINGGLKQAEMDMVVLATGMKPATDGLKAVKPDALDRNGFVKNNGIIGCGVCSNPKDVAGSVQESTGAAIQAIHTIRGNG